MQPYFLFGMYYTIFESLESIILPQMQKGTFNLTGSQYNNCHKILKNASTYLYRFQKYLYYISQGDLSQLKSLKPETPSQIMNCSHCTKKSEENKICFHCEKAYCIQCFTTHVSQFKSKSREILKQLEETKKQWHNLVEVNY